MFFGEIPQFSFLTMLKTGETRRLGGLSTSVGLEGAGESGS